MGPIIIDAKNNFDEYSFEDYLMQVAKKHKDQGRAMAFAFIIYDFKNHVINEILEKRNYWNKSKIFLINLSKILEEKCPF